MAVEGEDFKQTVDERPDAEGTIHRLVVIHHDGEGRVNLEHLVDQLSHDGGWVVEEIASQGGQRCSGMLAESWEALADSAHQVLDERAQVTVTLIGGVPTHRHRAVLREVHQRRGLAVASRGGDKRQFTFEPSLDGLAHPRPVQKASGTGHEQFGTDEGKARGNQCFRGSYARLFTNLHRTTILQSIPP